MTGALCVYSAVFMRYSLAVSPANYLLFGCHLINEASQLSQGYRFLNYHYGGGKEAAAKQAVGQAAQGVREGAARVNEEAGKAVESVKSAVRK